MKLEKTEKKSAMFDDVTGPQQLYLRNKNVQFGNNWMEKNSVDSQNGVVQFGCQEFLESNYF